MDFKELTLIIPAKDEEYSLPKVLNEILRLNCKKTIVLTAMLTRKISKSNLN